MQKTLVWSLGWEDPWRRAWQPTPVFLPGESAWTAAEPGRLPSIASQRVRHDWATKHSTVRCMERIYSLKEMSNAKAKITIQMNNKNIMKKIHIEKKRVQTVLCNLYDILSLMIEKKNKSAVTRGCTWGEGWLERNIRKAFWGDSSGRYTGIHIHQDSGLYT